jgi:hypothetical protein
MYKKGHDPNATARLVGVAKLLGDHKQGANQIAGEPGFPAPLSQDSCGQLWRRDVERWRRSACREASR